MTTTTEPNEPAKRTKRGPIPPEEKLQALHDTTAANLSRLREREQKLRDQLVAVTAQRETAERNLVRYKRAMVDDVPARALSLDEQAEAAQ